MIDNFVKDKLKASIPIEEVAEHLGLREKLGLKKSGGALCGNCLTGHSSDSGTCFKLYRNANQFHCFSCGESFDAIELIEREKGLSYKDACFYLAEVFRADLLEELRGSTIASPENRKSYSNASLYEMIFDHGKDLLFQKAGQEAYDYLSQVRGYGPSSLAETEWIYWPADAAIRSYLAENLPAERQSEAFEIKLNGAGGDVFRAALPYRDRFGKIAGFAKRATIKEGINGRRWDYTSGLKKDDLFGLYACKREKHLVLVEGLPDATYLPALGMKNVVATGQGELSARHIEGLKIYEVESVVIVFDNEKKNSKGEIGSVEKAKKAADLLEKNGIKAFILPPQVLGTHKDPDEYVRTLGVDVFRNLIAESAESRARWLPSYFAYKHDLATDIGLHSALGKASKAYADLDSALDQKDFRKSLEYIFQLNSQETDEILSRALKDEEKREREEHRKRLLEEVRLCSSQGNFEKAVDLLKELESTSIASSPPAIRLAHELMHDHNAYLEGYRGKRYVGLPQYRLPALDEMTLGLRGLMLLAAAPNVGKTALTIQLAIDILKENEDACVLYLSLEMPWKSIYSRIRCHLAEMDWKTLTFGSDKRPGSDNWFSSNDWDRLQKGDQVMEKIGKRLCILSEDSCAGITVDSVIHAIEALKEKTGCLRTFVVIDYLQVWPIPEAVSRQLRNDLELDKWRVGQLKLLREHLVDDPVLAISEARKPAGNNSWAEDMSDVMGSARASYTPDMVFLCRSLLNKSEMQKALGSENGSLSDDQWAQVVKTYEEEGCDIQRFSLQKGRDGTKRGSIFLKFYYRKNIFKELSLLDLKKEIDAIKQPSPIKKPSKNLYAVDDAQF